MSKSRYKFKNGTEEALSVVYFISSFGGILRETKSEKVGLLRKRISSIYMNIKLLDLLFFIYTFKNILQSISKDPLLVSIIESEIVSVIVFNTSSYFILQEMFLTVIVTRIFFHNFFRLSQSFFSIQYFGVIFTM